MLQVNPAINQQFCTHKKQHQLPVPNIFFGKILNFASNDNDGTVLDTVNVFKHTLSTLWVVYTV